MKINVITTLMLAAIGLVADIVTILSVSLSQSGEKISDAHYFGLYLIGVLVALFSLQLYWDSNKEKNNYETNYWLFILNYIILKANIKVLAPFLILTIVFLMTQSFIVNFLFILCFTLLTVSLFVYNYERNNKSNVEIDNSQYLLEYWVKIEELITYKMSHEAYIDEDILYELLTKHRVGIYAYVSKSYTLTILEKYAKENIDNVDFGMIKEKKTGKIIRPDKILINLNTFNLKDYEVVK